MIRPPSVVVRVRHIKSSAAPASHDAQGRRRAGPGRAGRCTHVLISGRPPAIREAGGGANKTWCVAEWSSRWSIFVRPIAIMRNVWRSENRGSCAVWDVTVRRWFQLRFDFDPTENRPPFDSHSTTVRPRCGRSTFRPTCSRLLHCDLLNRSAWLRLAGCVAVTLMTYDNLISSQTPVERLSKRSRIVQL